MLRGFLESIDKSPAEMTCAAGDCYSNHGVQKQIRRGECVAKATKDVVDVLISRTMVDRVVRHQNLHLMRFLRLLYIC